MTFNRLDILKLVVIASAAITTSAQAQSTTWAEAPESLRAAATEFINARSNVSIVRQGLAAADLSGSRSFAGGSVSETEALRGTFSLAIPLHQAPGRSQPLEIALRYQARVWMGGETGNLASLDDDLFNAPGWSLGLPKMLGAILIEGDGTRRAAVKTRGWVGDDMESASYITTDGSHIKYTIVTDIARRSASAEGILP